MNFAHNCTLDDSQALVSKDIFSPLLANLGRGDTQLTIQSLKALYEILAHGEILKKSHNGYNPYLNQIYQAGQIPMIEGLQEHPDNQVYQEVSNLINRYFQTVDNNQAEVTFN